MSFPLITIKMLMVMMVMITMATLFDAACGQRLRDTMYDSLYAGGACYRRLNGTHQIGCSSKRGGSVGVIHVVRDISDVQWIVENGTAPPYVPFFPMHLFTLPMIDLLLENAELIAGVIVYDNGTERIKTFSHEYRCPNRRSHWNPFDGFESCSESDKDENVWNPHGTGLMYRDYPFSIYYLPSNKKEDIEKIHDCFVKFNSFDLIHQSERSLCAVEMDAFMYAAVNSEVCVRRSNILRHLSPTRYCESLMDHSIYITLFPRGAFSTSTNTKKNDSTFEERFKLTKPNLKEDPGSIALVTAAMDATTMLEGFGGAVTTISGLVTLLSVAHTLGSMIPTRDQNLYERNVIFAILNGESYDYIGSQRMAWDLAAGSYPQKGSDPVPPVSPMAIGPHVHLGQFQNNQDPLHIYIPIYVEPERGAKAAEFVEWMNVSADSVVEKTHNLPPSSVHSFLRFLNSSITQMTSMVITDHGRNFKNQFYQSVLDDKNNLEYSYLNVSQNITKGENNATIFPDDLFTNSNSIQVRLANVSNHIAMALYRHVTGNSYNGDIKASPFIIDELFHCYLDTIACKLLNVVQSPSAPPLPLNVNIPPTSLYVGTSSWSTISHATAQFAAFLTGTNANRNKTDCKPLENESVDYEWLAGWTENGTCIRSVLNFTQAVSPAFIEENYDFSSGIYSTWTESYWSSISLRILVKPAAWRENLTVGIGCTIFIISLVISFIGKRHVIWLINSDVLNNTGNVANHVSSRVDC